MHLNVPVVGPGNMLDLSLYKDISGMYSSKHYVADEGVKVRGEIRDVYYHNYIIVILCILSLCIFSYRQYNYYYIIILCKEKASKPKNT